MILETRYHKKKVHLQLSRQLSLDLVGCFDLKVPSFSNFNTFSLKGFHVNPVFFLIIVSRAVDLSSSFIKVSLQF